MKKAFRNHKIVIFFFILISADSCHYGVTGNTGFSLFGRNISQNSYAIDSIREKLYVSYPEKYDTLLNLIDTSSLTNNEMGKYYLTKSLISVKEGDYIRSTDYLKHTVSQFASRIPENINAEMNLIWGMISANYYLFHESSSRFYDALKYFATNKSPKYFYCLIGLARNNPADTLFLSKAFDYLKSKPNRYLERIYYFTKAATITELHKRLKTFTVIYRKYGYSLNNIERVKLCATLALSYNNINNADSAFFYINKADSIITKSNIPAAALINFYLIKGFVFFNNDDYNEQKAYIAKNALDSAYKIAKDHKVMLANVYLQFSQMHEKQKKFEKALYELKHYALQMKKDNKELQDNQLAFLTVKYRLQEKQLEITKTRNLWLTYVIVLSALLLLLIIIFMIHKQKSNKEKLEMKNLITITIKEKNELRDRFEKVIDTQNSKNTNNKYFKWNNFRVKFITDNPEFIEKLKEINPKVNSTDIKYSMCVYCNLSNREISELLNVTPDAVKKAKRKLSKIFNLENTAELTNFFDSLFSTRRDSLQ